MSSYGYDSVGNVPTFYEGPRNTGRNKLGTRIRIMWLRRRLATHRSAWASWSENGKLVRF